MGEIRLGDEHARTLRSVGVFVRDGPPTALDGRQSRLIPHRAVSHEFAYLLVLREVGETGFLDHRVGDVNAETIDTAVEPEPQNAVKLLDDFGVFPVPVGL